MTRAGKLTAWLRRAMFGLTLAAMWFCVAHPHAAASDSEDSLEYAVKAVFLFRFGSFIEWPPTAFEATDAPFVIGVIGDDPFGARIDQIVAGQTIEGRPVVVWHTHRVEQVRGAHILFISQSEKERMETIMAGLQGRPVLTVAEFPDPNVIINFVVENNKVRFEVNLEQAERVGLKLSSKMLSVARTVRGK